VARLTKKDLKAILKECLREILKEEGIVLSEQKSHGGVGNTRYAPAPEMKPEAPIQNNRLLETVNQTADRFAVKGNGEADMMRQILADTAATTLQTQNAAGHAVGANGSGAPMGDMGAGYEMPTSPQQAAQERAELSELSHEGDIGRWAKVAFAGKGSN
jgi:hypothetical protein